MGYQGNYPKTKDERLEMKDYKIGDIVKDEDGNKGIVVIRWNDGDLVDYENDAAHPNPIKIGHISQK